MAQKPAVRCLMLTLLLCTACISAPVNSADTITARDVEVKVKVPDTGWEIRIIEIRQGNETLWVVSSLTRRPGPAGQAISTVSDRVSMDLPGFPIKHYILGKTWKWENKEPYSFINSTDEIAGQLENSRLLYQRP